MIDYSDIDDLKRKIEKIFEYLGDIDIFFYNLNINVEIEDKEVVIAELFCQNYTTTIRSILNNIYLILQGIEKREEDC